MRRAHALAAALLLAIGCPRGQPGAVRPGPAAAPAAPGPAAAGRAGAPGPADPAPGAPTTAERERAQAGQLLQTFRAVHRSPGALAGEAKAQVDAPEGKGRYSLLFTVVRPASLRIDALLPWGEPAATLVAHEGLFFYRDERRKQFLRGPSTPANLARLLPAPLTDDELCALFAGDLPDLPGAELLAARADGARVRFLSGRGPDDAPAFRGRSQEALVEGGNLLEVLRRIGGPGSPLLWAASLADHEVEGGYSLPRLIRLRVPKETSGEAQDIAIELRIKSVQPGAAPAPAAFTLQPSPGMELLNLR